MHALTMKNGMTYSKRRIEMMALEATLGVMCSHIESPNSNARFSRLPKLRRRTRKALVTCGAAIAAAEDPDVRLYPAFEPLRPVAPPPRGRTPFAGTRGAV